MIHLTVFVFYMYVFYCYFIVFVLYVIAEIYTYVSILLPSIVPPSFPPFLRSFLCAAHEITNSTMATPRPALLCL